MARIRNIALLALAAVVSATPAMALNEYQLIFASSCTGALGCQRDVKTSAKPGDPIGGLAVSRFASASLSGFSGGLVNSRSGFVPSAATLDGQYREDSGAELTYTFQVTGASNTFVPIRIHGYASIGPIQASTDDGGHLTVDTEGMPSGSTSFNIAAAASLSILGTGLFHGSTGPAGASVTLGSHLDPGVGDYRIAGQGALIDTTVYFLSNTDINVAMGASTSLKYYGSNTGNLIFGSVMASADPTFTIEDPAFSAFNIVGVPTGPSPAGAVPEPATWAMLVGGFGLIGGTMRRRRSVVSLA